MMGSVSSLKTLPTQIHIPKPPIPEHNVQMQNSMFLV